MNPKVRDLYKRVLHVGRDYPLGLPTVRERAKQWFRANAHLTDETEIHQAVARGRWYVNEMIGVIKLKKCAWAAIISLTPMHTSIHAHPRAVAAPPATHADRAMRQRYGEFSPDLDAAMQRLEAAGKSDAAAAGAAPPRSSSGSAPPMQ